MKLPKLTAILSPCTWEPILATSVQSKTFTLKTRIFGESPIMYRPRYFEPGLELRHDDLLLVGAVVADQLLHLRRSAAGDTGLLQAELDFLL